MCNMGFPDGASGEEPACQCKRHNRHGFDPWVRKIPWRRAWQPTPEFLPGESHRQRTRWATVHEVIKSWTRLKRLSMHMGNVLTGTAPSSPVWTFSSHSSRHPVVFGRIKGRRGLEAAENHSPQSLMSAQKTHQNDSLPRVSFSQAVVVGVGQCKFMNTWLWSHRKEEKQVAWKHSFLPSSPWWWQKHPRSFALALNPCLIPCSLSGIAKYSAACWLTGSWWVPGTWSVISDFWRLPWFLCILRPECSTWTLGAYQILLINTFYCLNNWMVAGFATPKYATGVTVNLSWRHLRRADTSKAPCPPLFA